MGNKNWADYFDVNSLLTQKGGDGGDTPSHEGLAWLAAHFGGNFPSPLGYGNFIYEVSPNEKLIRNPITYNNPNDTSRDQYRAVVVADFFQNPHGLFSQDFYKNLPKNFLGWAHYPNGDVFNPQDYVLFHPNANYAWKLLSDVMALFGVLTLVCWTTRKPGFITKALGKLWWPFIAMNPPNNQGVQGSLRGPDYTSDDLGTIETLLYSKYNGTFLNKLNRWIYRTFRPNGVQWALDSYFAEDIAPPINEISQGMVKEL
jgi:hypothetical protein